MNLNSDSLSGARKEVSGSSGGDVGSDSYDRFVSRLSTLRIKYIEDNVVVIHKLRNQCGNKHEDHKGSKIY